VRRQQPDGYLARRHLPGGPDIHCDHGCRAVDRHVRSRDRALAPAAGGVREVSPPEPLRAVAGCATRSPRPTTAPALCDAKRQMRVEAGRIAMLNRGLLVVAFLVAGQAIAHAEDTVRVGEVRSIGSGATLTAIERGYFKEQGIKVELDAIDSSANAFALLAQNRYQIVEGGLSAGYFNGLDKNLPIIPVAD